MRIGILGGMFDPIHVGHLALAQAALDQLGLDRLIFIPSFISPVSGKEIQTAPAELRFKMVRASIKGISSYEVSDIELSRKGVSYTVDTLRELRKIYPLPHELFFITGGDWGKRLDQWKEIDAIFSICHFVVAKRPGSESLRLPKQVQFLDFCPFDISSTQIREMIRSNQSADQWVPKPALDIIHQNQLYREV